MKLKSQNSKFKTILILSTLYSLLSTSFLCGCEAFRKKFVRKPKPKKEEVGVVVRTYEYESEYSTEMLYKRNYVFWRAAHNELVNLLNENNPSRKRQVFAAKNIVDSLRQMQELLLPQKQSGLDKIIKIQKDIVRELDRYDVSFAQKMRLIGILEKQRRQIQKEFHYKGIQEYLAKE